MAESDWAYDRYGNRLPEPENHALDFLAMERQRAEGLQRIDWEKRKQMEELARDREYLYRRSVGWSAR